MPRHRKIIPILLAAIFLFLIFGCEPKDKKQKGPDVNRSEQIDGTLDFLNLDGEVLATITIEIAETLEEHRKGLMERHSLNPMHGMLFIFNRPELKSFWMQNTYIPLDIIYIDKNKQVVKIIEKAEPLSTTPRRSIEPIQYAVEVNGGFAKRFGIRKMDRVRWQRTVSPS